jgi:hypothetical protein
MNKQLEQISVGSCPTCGWLAQFIEGGIVKALSSHVVKRSVLEDIISLHTSSDEMKSDYDKGFRDGKNEVCELLKDMLNEMDIERKTE